MYEAFGGATWLRADGWGSGHPCENGWYGVSCCPENLPEIDETDVCRPAGYHEAKRRPGSPTPSGNRTAFQYVATAPSPPPGSRLLSVESDGVLGEAAFPAGCWSGLSMGDERDLTRCVVAKIDLHSNNLTGQIDANSSGTPRNMLCGLANLQWLNLFNNTISGPLPDDIGPYCLPSLRYLDLEDNQLSGRLPRFISDVQFEQVKLGYPEALGRDMQKPPGNNFDYPPGRTTPEDRSYVEYLERIFRQCDAKPRVTNLLTGVVEPACTGIPAQTCDAFGGVATLYVPQTTAKSRLRCSKCPNDYLGLVLAAAALFLGMFVCIVAYAILVSKKAEATQMWVSSVSIVWYHTVTISIIGAMRLSWPPSVKFLTGALSISFFGIEFMNPQCLLRAFGPNGFQVFVVGRLCVFLALLFFPSVLSFITSLCVRTNVERRKKILDLLEFLQTIIFAMQLTASWKLIMQFLTQYDFKSDRDAWLTVFGLTTTITLVVLEAYVVSKYIFTMYKLRTEGKFEAIGLTPARLKRRLAYLTNRYAEHCQHHWQFVTWGRLLVLTFITQSPDVVSSYLRHGRNNDETTREGGLTTAQIEHEAQIDQYVVWLHAAAACVTFCFFGVWHVRAQPFRWDFQNIIETGLYVSDILAVGLGVLYTIISAQAERTTIETGVEPSSFSRMIVEGLILTAVLSSLVVSIGIMCWQWRQNHREKMESRRKQEDADAYRGAGRDQVRQENLARMAARNEKVAVRPRAVSRGRVGLRKDRLTMMSGRREGASMFSMSSGRSRKETDDASMHRPSKWASAGLPRTSHLDAVHPSAVRPQVAPSSPNSRGAPPIAESHDDAAAAAAARALPGSSRWMRGGSPTKLAAMAKASAISGRARVMSIPRAASFGRTGGGRPQAPPKRGSEDDLFGMAPARNVVPTSRRAAERASRKNGASGSARGSGESGRRPARIVEIDARVSSRRSSDEAGAVQVAAAAGGGGGITNRFAVMAQLRRLGSTRTESRRKESARADQPASFVATKEPLPTLPAPVRIPSPRKGKGKDRVPPLDVGQSSSVASRAGSPSLSFGLGSLPQFASSSRLGSPPPSSLAGSDGAPRAPSYGNDGAPRAQALHSNHI